MAKINEPQDWQFTPEQIGAFLNWLNRNPMRDWRARAWFIATVTAWLSFVVALWAAFVWPDLRTLAFAVWWCTVAIILSGISYIRVRMDE